MTDGEYKLQRQIDNLSKEIIELKIRLNCTELEVNRLIVKCPSLPQTVYCSANRYTPYMDPTRYPYKDTTSDVPIYQETTKTPGKLDGT